MKIYEVVKQKQPDGNDVFCCFDVVTDADRRTLNRNAFRGQPFPLEKWVPFKIMRSPTTPGNLTKPLGDRAGIDFKTDPLVLSRRALDVLLPHIHSFGEVLPLDFDEADYSFFNITNVVDALDIDKSEVEYFASGNFNRVKRYAFKLEMVQDRWIFKIPQQPRGFAFVTERFVQVAQDAKLTGFRFDELWSDEEPAQPSMTAAQSQA